MFELWLQQVRLAGAACKCCGQVDASKSARAFKNPAPILSKPAVRPLIDGSPRSIIEYGAGNLRNVRFLLQKGHRVSVVELLPTIERYRDEYAEFRRKGGVVFTWETSNFRSTSPRKFDIALITFVLETICRPSERRGLLEHCRRSLKKSGVLVLSVRGHRDVVAANASGTPCSDGYSTSGKTFIRGFDLKEISHLLLQSGFTSIRALHSRNPKNPELLHVLAK